MSEMQIKPIIISEEETIKIVGIILIALNWGTLKKRQPFFQIVNFYESHESRAQGSLENIDYDFNNVKLRAYHPDLEIIRKNMQNITMLY